MKRDKANKADIEYISLHTTDGVDTISKDIGLSVKEVRRLLGEKKEVVAPARKVINSAFQHNREATIMTPAASQQSDSMSKSGKPNPSNTYKARPDK